MSSIPPPPAVPKPPSSPPRPPSRPPSPRPPPPGYVNDLEWQGITVIVSLVLGIITMGFDLVPPDVVCAGLMAFYTAAQIITVTEAARGFSNNGLLTVVALYVVAEGVSRTGGLERLMNKFLGRTTSTFWALARLQVPIMFVSAFLNNTPIVSLMIPILMSWCRRTGLSAKQMLIPLSHLTVFGGTITLIGTSTNLVVSSLQQQRYPNNPALSNFDIFQITPYGFPYAVWGAMYIILFTQYLLPKDTHSRTDNLLVGLRVLPFSSLNNTTFSHSSVRNLDGLSLAAVGRAGVIMHDIPEDFVFAFGDILYFRGEFALVERVCHTLGLALVTSETEDSRFNAAGWGNPEAGHSATDGPQANQHLYEVYVRPKSQLVGSTIRDIGFRSRFHASVVAVHRAGKQDKRKIGEIPLAAGDRLLLDVADDFDPSSKDVRENFHDVERVVADFREFTVGFQVIRGDLMDSFVGKSIAMAGLRGIPGLFLTSITRSNGEILHAVSPDTKLELNDILWFAGNVDGIQYLLKQATLAPVSSEQTKKMKVDILNRRLVQVAVGATSSLLDKTAKQVEFRTKYDAVLVAIHRKGARLEGNVADVRLQAGDVLLLDTGDRFIKRFQEDKAFSLVSEVPESAPVKTQSAWIAVLLATFMVLTQIVGAIKDEEYINLWPCAILTGILMIIFRCMSFEEARRSIMWDVYLTIASTFAIGMAMDKTAVASKIADVAADASRAIGGQTAALSAIYITTAILSELLSNNSAAAIFYPIASRLGDKLGIDPKLISITVMLGASAGWIMPWGYQCNLMVFNAGNYKAREFMRVGIPLVFWLWGGATVIFALVDHPAVPIILSLACMGAVLSAAFAWTVLPGWVRESVRLRCRAVRLSLASLRESLTSSSKTLLGSFQQRKAAQRPAQDRRDLHDVISAEKDQQ